LNLPSCGDRVGSPMALAPKRGSELLGPVKNEGGVVGTAKHSALK
jgi:hypothetical protein